MAIIVHGSKLPRLFVKTGYDARRVLELGEDSGDVPSAGTVYWWPVARLGNEMVYVCTGVTCDGAISCCFLKS
jgi:hypothetical protein